MAAMSSYLSMSSELVMGTEQDVMENDVRERRARRGLSQAQLAEAVKVSRQTINSIEKGRYIPSLPLALALARYFETTVEEMFSDDGA
jgi:putative transcriptional regulator